MFHGCSLWYIPCGLHHMRVVSLRRFATAFAAAAVALMNSAPTASAVVPWTPGINTNFVVNVTNYGAVGDGVTTNTAAIQNAIQAAAAGGTTNGLSGGTVEFPAGVYLSGPLVMQSRVNLQIDSNAIVRMLPFGQYPLTYFTNVAATYLTNGSSITTNFSTNITWTAVNFIAATNLQDIAITGSGAIDGQGEPWWPYAYTNGDTRPIMIRWTGCNRQLIRGVTLSNSPMFHINISGRAGNTTVQGVTIRAPSSRATPPSHNTDACDASGTNVLVQNCDISVGDDNYTCSGGTSDVLITGNTYGDGHGVSIGSYTSPGVSNLTVINCTFNNTEAGIRIKSENDRGGLVQNISYYNLSMTNVRFPIVIYGYYTNIGTPSKITPYRAATQAVEAVTSKTPVYRNIVISNITATAASGYPAGLIWARTEMPATNIVLSRVNISAFLPFEIYNAAQVRIVDSQISPPASTNTFLLFNAQVAISNSAPGGPPVSFDGITTNGYGSALDLYNAPAWLKNTNLFDDGPLALGAGTFTVSNHLTLFPATVLHYTLGTNAATVAVAGNLTLGGTNTIVAGGGFTSGTYTLLTYAGRLNGDLPILGTVPPDYYYTFDTYTPGQVNLIVSTSPPDTNAPITATVFSDTFAGSTLNSALPAAPTAVSTSYELVSSKTWSPAPSLAGGHLKFGIAATTSGAIEAQARFTDSPVSLIRIGDNISLTVIFTNAAGLLTQSGSLGFGLYNSGGNDPAPGGLNGTATTNYTANASGNVQTWSGYVGQVSYTGENSRIMTRAPQTGTHNNNQDLVTSGSSSMSYNNPAAATVGAFAVSTLTLTGGSPCTDVLTITLTGPDVLAITNSVFAGAGTNGALLTRFGGLASGAAYLTNAFDALAVGWRARTNGSATAIDINRITVSSTLTRTAPPPSLTPPLLDFETIGQQLQLTWPATHTGWTLQIQTNSLSKGLGTDWVNVPDSETTNRVLVPIVPTHGSVFLRLIFFGL
jgi:polygalacturonase